SANGVVALGSGVEKMLPVSRWAASLRHAVAQAHPDHARFCARWPDGHEWAAAFTHDLDVVALWPFFSALRLAELARKGGWGRGSPPPAGGAALIVGELVVRAVERVIEIEGRASLRWTWFVLCGTPTLQSFSEGDLTYSPASRRARHILDLVKR